MTRRQASKLHPPRMAKRLLYALPLAAAIRAAFGPR